MNEEFVITISEARTLRFYAGIENVIYDIERTMQKRQREKRGDWNAIVEIQKIELKEMQSLLERLTKYVCGDNE